MMPPTMAQAAPANMDRPRHTVQEPTASDHAVAPRPSSAPAAMRTQGLASYNVCGVQGRIQLVYAHGRARSHFVRMTQYAFCTYSERPGPPRRLVGRPVAHGHPPDGGLRALPRPHLFRRPREPRAL